jgi:hypothetical protein
MRRHYGITIVLLLLLLMVLLAACATSHEPTADPGCDSFPGMPDRPCDPADTRRSDYRIDTPEAFAATGRPQLLVIHYIMPPERQGMGCVACRVQMPTVHQLEADYWERIDFIYLERSSPVVKPLLQQFGITSSINNARLNLILVDAAGEELIRFYEGVNLNTLTAESPEIEYYRAVLDRQLEKLAAN